MLTRCLTCWILTSSSSNVRRLSHQTQKKTSDLMSVLLLDIICVPTAQEVCKKDSYPWHTEEWRQRIKDNYCCPWNTIERRPAMTYRSMTTAHETDERLLPMAYRSMTAGYKTKTTNTPKMCEMWAAEERSWNRETCYSCARKTLQNFTEAM